MLVVCFLLVVGIEISMQSDCFGQNGSFGQNDSRLEGKHIKHQGVVYTHMKRKVVNSTLEIREKEEGVIVAS